MIGVYRRAVWFVLYCVQVPGSGFGQVDGTWHFRTTFLPQESQVDSFIAKIQAFHSKFMATYADK
jgi:alanine transaminase